MSILENAVGKMESGTVRSQPARELGRIARVGRSANLQGLPPLSGSVGAQSPSKRGELQLNRRDAIVSD